MIKLQYKDIERHPMHMSRRVNIIKMTIAPKVMFNATPKTPRINFIKLKARHVYWFHSIYINKFKKVPSILCSAFLSNNKLRLHMCSNII